MRYRLRTLLILLAVGPPVLASALLSLIVLWQLLPWLPALPGALAHTPAWLGLAGYAEIFALLFVWSAIVCYAIHPRVRAS